MVCFLAGRRFRSGRVTARAFAMLIMYLILMVNLGIDKLDKVFLRLENQKLVGSG